MNLNFEQDQFLSEERFSQIIHELRGDLIAKRAKSLSVTLLQFGDYEIVVDGVRHRFYRVAGPGGYRYFGMTTTEAL